MNIEKQLNNNYDEAKHDLWHQENLLEDLHDDNPSQLRATTLGMIKRRIKLAEARVKAYEIVADELLIDLDNKE